MGEVSTAGACLSIRSQCNDSAQGTLVLIQTMSFSKITRLHRTLLAAWKYCISYRKAGWNLSDYPLHIVQQIDPEMEQSGPTWRRIPPYRADIVNWHDISGIGETPEFAIQNLMEAFNKRRATEEPLPRPGSRVSITVKFASSDRIDSHRNLANDFIEEVLGLPWAFISNGSSLWDFTTESTLDAYFAKIKERYGIDASAVEGGTIAEILALIEDSQKRTDSAGPHCEY